MAVKSFLITIGIFVFISFLGEAIYWISRTHPDIMPFIILGILSVVIFVFAWTLVYSLLEDQDKEYDSP